MVARNPSSSSHTLIGGFAGAIASCWFWSSSWYKAGKTGCLLGVLIMPLYYLAPLLGALISYLMSIWLLNASKKSIYPKIFTALLMILTIWFVESQMIYFEQKKPRFDSHFGVLLLRHIKWF
jgi:PiT family inorganic phosphate transporter